MDGHNLFTTLHIQLSHEIKRTLLHYLATSGITLNTCPPTLPVCADNRAALPSSTTLLLDSSSFQASHSMPSKGGDATLKEITEIDHCM